MRIQLIPLNFVFLSQEFSIFYNAWIFLTLLTRVCNWALPWTGLFPFILWTSVTLGPILNQTNSVHILYQSDCALPWTSLIQFIHLTSVTLHPFLNQCNSVHILNQSDNAPYPEPGWHWALSWTSFSSYPVPIWHCTLSWTSLIQFTPWTGPTLGCNLN